MTKGKEQFDVTALGELLVDFTFFGISENGMKLFERNPGGAPANVVCAASKLGLDTAFVGKVGADMHGAFLELVLRNHNVDTTGLVVSPDVFTTLAFVELSEGGERSFSFARKPGADIMLDIKDLNMDVIKNSGIFHIGSLSLTDEPARSATVYALQKAKEAHSIISYDPNYRESLWRCVGEARKQIVSVLPFVDLIKISDEETELMTGYKEPEKALERLINQGIPLVIVTLGGRGALVGTRDGSVLVSAVETKAADTTGAGDAFLGGYLYKLAKSKVRPHELSLNMAAEFASFANKAAGICVSRRGAINAMPSLSEVE